MSLSDAQSRIAVLISADGSGAIREIQKVGQAADKDLGKASSNVDKLGNRLTYGGAAAMGFAAMAGGALYSFAKASDEAHQSELKLQNSMRNSPALANTNIESFKKLAQSIQGKTAADGDMVLGSMAVLAQFRLTEAQIKQVTPLVVDYARKMGVDLDTAAKNVGKALDGKATALQKAGIHLDENVYKTDRLKAVTDGLRGAVGGFAEQEGQTFSGKLERLKNQMNDLKESIGGGVISTVGPLMDSFGKLAQGASQVDEKTGGMVGKIASIGVGVTGAVGALSFLSGTFLKLKGQMTAAEGGLTGFGKAASGLAIAGLGVAIFELFNQIEKSTQSAKVNVEDLRGAVDAYANSRLLQGTLKEQISNYHALSESVWVLNNRTDQYVKNSQHWYQAFSGGAQFIPQHYFNLTSIDEAKDKIGKLDAELVNLVQSGKSQAAADLFRQISENAVKGGSSVEDVNKAFEKYKKALENTEGSANKNVQNWRETGQAITDAELSLTEYISKQMELAGSNVSTELALLRLDESYDRLRVSTQDGTSSTRDAKIATDEFALSLLSNANAQSDLTLKTSNAQTEDDKARIKKQALLEALDRLKTQYPLLSSQVQGFIDTINRTPGTKDTTVTVNTAEAEAKILAWKNWALGQLRYAFGMAGAAPDIPGRAIGGPVQAGRAYIVGERGPELMVPNANGTIIPNNALTAVGGGRSASTYNVTVNVSAGAHPATVGAEVVNAIKAYERSNGSSWRGAA